MSWMTRLEPYDLPASFSDEDKRICANVVGYVYDGQAPFAMVGFEHGALGIDSALRPLISAKYVTATFPDKDTLLITGEGAHEFMRTLDAYNRSLKSPRVTLSGVSR